MEAFQKSDHFILWKNQFSSGLELTVKTGGVSSKQLSQGS